MLKLSNIQKIDFAKLYKKQKAKSSFKPKSVKDWDKKAKYLSGKIFKSIYVDEFIQKVDTKGAKTLLDVGSGPGTLGVSLADEFEHVYCLDFSPKMLECVKKNAKMMGITNVKTIQKSFDDDWSDVPKVDVLIASRCMEVGDLKKTLKLLNSKAKKVYITYKVGGSFVDTDILNILDKPIVPKPDFIYLVNTLYQMGINAKVDFIQSENSRFDTKNVDEFIEKVRWSLGKLSKKDEKRLKLFHSQQKSKQGEKSYLKWAFISYETGN